MKGEKNVNSRIGENDVPIATMMNRGNLYGIEVIIF